jgi:hypothetical protein
MWSSEKKKDVGFTPASWCGVEKKKRFVWFYMKINIFILKIIALIYYSHLNTYIKSIEWGDMQESHSTSYSSI